MRGILSSLVLSTACGHSSVFDSEPQPIGYLLPALQRGVPRTGKPPCRPWPSIASRKRASPWVTLQAFVYCRDVLEILGERAWRTRDSLATVPDCTPSCPRGTGKSHPPSSLTGIMGGDRHIKLCRSGAGYLPWQWRRNLIRAPSAETCRGDCVGIASHSTAASPSSPFWSLADQGYPPCKGSAGKDVRDRHRGMPQTRSKYPEV